jgi:hypothetical protein
MHALSAYIIPALPRSWVDTPLLCICLGAGSTALTAHLSARDAAASTVELTLSTPVLVPSLKAANFPNFPKPDTLRHTSTQRTVVIAATVSKTWHHPVSTVPRDNYTMI